MDCISSPIAVYLILPFLRSYILRLPYAMPFTLSAHRETVHHSIDNAIIYHRRIDYRNKGSGCTTDHHAGKTPLARKKGSCFETEASKHYATPAIKHRAALKQNKMYETGPETSSANQTSLILWF